MNLLATKGKFIRRITFLKRHEKLWEIPSIYCLFASKCVSCSMETNENSPPLVMFISLHTFHSYNSSVTVLSKRENEKREKCSWGKIKCKTSERKVSTAHATRLGVWLITSSLAWWRKIVHLHEARKRHGKKWIFIFASEQIAAVVTSQGKN